MENSETNRDKLNKAIGLALDKVNIALEKKEAPDTDTLVALNTLAHIASSISFLLQ